MAWSRVAVLGLGLALIGCRGGVPAPPFVTPFDKTSPDSIRAYLGQLDFDKRDGIGDDQKLLIGCPDRCQVGPRVAIYPEKRTHQNHADQLAKGPGRIVAQIINYDDKQDYQPLNLRAGDTLYWAVDSLRSQSDRNQPRGRSLYISARALREGRTPAVVARRELFIDEHPDQKQPGVSLARWIFDTTGYEADVTPGGHEFAPQRIWTMVSWNNCKSGGCCR